MGARTRRASSRTRHRGLLVALAADLLAGGCAPAGDATPEPDYRIEQVWWGGWCEDGRAGSDCATTTVWDRSGQVSFTDGHGDTQQLASVDPSQVRRVGDRIVEQHDQIVTKESRSCPPTHDGTAMRVHVWVYPNDPLADAYELVLDSCEHDFGAPAARDVLHEASRTLRDWDAG